MHDFFCYVCLVLFVPCSVFVSLIIFFIPTSYFRRKKDIAGQKVLITGAGNGLGRQLAIQFSNYSTFLILVDINKQSLLETEKLLNKKSNAFSYECDVSDHQQVYEMAKRVRREVGDVDILVNNAGVVSGNYLKDLSEKDILRTFGVNVLAHFWTFKAFLPAMVARNRGHLVSVVSILGRGPLHRLSDYCASKYAALGFAEAIEMELAEMGADGIRVTTVFPSHMDTNLFRGANLKIGGIQSAAHVAKVAVQGVLEEREAIFVPRLFEYLSMSKELFPRWLVIELSKWFGILRTLDNFKAKMRSPEILSKDN